MDTHKKIREHISALADGALPADDVELALAALQTADGRQAWDVYHRIGDTLRNQATPELSDGFSARLAARLALEAAPGKRTPRKRAAPRSEGTAAALSNGKAAPAAGPAGVGASAAHDDATLDAKAVVKPKPAVASVS